MKSFELKRGIAIALALILLCMTCCAEGVTPPFLRIDRDDPAAWEGELDNVRLLKEGLYHLGKIKSKYGVEPDFVPSTEGLDTLNISGSAQFSVPQFHELANTLRECADGRTIYIVDLRRESHVMVNDGIALSWYEVHNWSNVGKTLEEIEADEAERFGAMVGQTLTAYGREDDTPINQTDITIESFITEKALVESEGFQYYRMPIQDHTWPTPEELDDFISFVKGLDPDQSWLHFHCQAGSGRTGIMMTVYDMMRNPDVPMMDLVVRQTMLGGSYPLYVEDSDNYKAPLYQVKARMTPLLYEYIQEQHASNYEIPWSQWLEAQDLQAAA